MKRSESFAGAASERDDLLAFVAVEGFAECHGGLVAPAGGFEHPREVAERAPVLQK